MHDLEIVGFWALGLVAAVLVIWFLWWCAKIGWRAGDEVGRAIKYLDQPVLTPPQIAQALEVEWHRKPTVQEVAAVQQMLHNERNQAMITAGVGLGALYLMLHHDQT